MNRIFNNIRFTSCESLGVGYDLEEIPYSGFYDVVDPVNGPGTGSYYIENFVNGVNVSTDSAAIQFAYEKALGGAWCRTFDETYGWSPWHSLSAGSRLDVVWGGMVGANSNATPTTHGCTFTGSGTATSRAVASTNKLSRTKRIGYDKASADDATAGGRTTACLWPEDGFFAAAVWGYTQIPAKARAFAGAAAGTDFVTADTASTEPTAGTNLAGVGFASATALANFNFLCNDGSGAATSVDTGIAVAVDTLYRVDVHKPKGVSKAIVMLTNLNSGLRAVHTFTSNIPANATALGVQCYVNTGANTPDAAAQIDLAQLYFEQAL